MSNATRSGRASLGIGAVLVGLGILFLLVQLFDFQFGQWLWPLIIIIPGLFCFVGMLLGGKPAGPLAIPGSIVTTIGLLLFYQNTFNHFESWAYAWALIPFAVGIGLVINGTWSEQPALVDNGRRLAATGLVLFLVGFVFFELVLNIGNMASGIIAPLLMIVAGIYMLLRRARRTTQPVAVAESVPAAASAEVAAQLSSPIVVARPTLAEAETVEQPVAALRDGQLSERELGAP